MAAAAAAEVAATATVRQRQLYEYINAPSMPHATCHMIAVRLAGRLAGQMTVANLIAFTYADADTFTDAHRCAAAF